MESINLASAKLIIEYFEHEASLQNTSGEINIVDKFGNAVAYVRLDNFQSADYSESLRLAKSAAAFSMPTERLAEETSSGQRFSHLRQSDSYSFGIGGYPIFVEDELVGAIGVLTGSEACTKALAEALLNKLNANCVLVFDDNKNV